MEYMPTKKQQVEQTVRKLCEEYYSDKNSKVVIVNKAQWLLPHIRKGYVAKIASKMVGY